ncbi:hypothetical protein B0H10DRAFT_878635 [Mycena sp. CBHHK59/15]|nr:hypothetical protein B0H10DRAFT_878635 [Mycena sp. CBHHK59/15]
MSSQCASGGGDCDWNIPTLIVSCRDGAVLSESGWPAPTRRPRPPSFPSFVSRFCKTLTSLYPPPRILTHTGYLPTCARCPPTSPRTPVYLRRVLLRPTRRAGDGAASSCGAVSSCCVRTGRVSPSIHQHPHPHTRALSVPVSLSRVFARSETREGGGDCDGHERLPAGVMDKKWCGWMAARISGRPTAAGTSEREAGASPVRARPIRNPHPLRLTSMLFDIWERRGYLKTCHCSYYDIIINFSGPSTGCDGSGSYITIGSSARRASIASTSRFCDERTKSGRASAHMHRASPTSPCRARISPMRIIASARRRCTSMAVAPSSTTWNTLSAVWSAPCATKMSPRHRSAWCVSPTALIVCASARSARLPMHRATMSVPHSCLRARQRVYNARAFAVSPRCSAHFAVAMSHHSSPRAQPRRAQSSVEADRCRMASSSSVQPVATSNCARLFRALA